MSDSVKNDTIRHRVVALGCPFKRQSGNLFEFRIPQMLTHIHLIVGVAIVYHPLGNGCRGVFFIRQNTNFLSSFNESPVELRPKATRQ